MYTETDVYCTSMVMLSRVPSHESSTAESDAGVLAVPNTRYGSVVCDHYRSLHWGCLKLVQAHSKLCSMKC